jgi:hypothetical protein
MTCIQAPGNCESLRLNCYSRGYESGLARIGETTIARIGSEIAQRCAQQWRRFPNAMLLCASTLSFVRSNAARRDGLWTAAG